MTVQQWIRKRNGQLQEFNPRKINKAVLGAFYDEDAAASLSDIAQIVNEVIQDLQFNEGVVNIESVQDTVVEKLLEYDTKIATHYIEYRTKRTIARKERLKPDNLAMAEYIHAAKYARWNATENRRETFEESVTRVKEMHLKRFPQFAEEIEEAFAFVYKRRILPSMRSMQFGGDPCEQHNARIYNCTFTLIDRIRVFQEVFYLLLCGAGVGFSVQFHHVAKLPIVLEPNKDEVYHHIIEDTIEGWADALGVLIESYMQEGHTSYIEFNYSVVRDKGKPISSGGKAPGHLPLKVALEKIRTLLQKTVGRKLRPIEAHDICCYLAEAVLAGGRRRSSLISLFSNDDGEMMRAKAKECFRPAFGNDPGVNNQRQLANNSSVLHRDFVTRNQFERVIETAEQNYGCPGYYFVQGEGAGYYGTNPCGEIGLNPTITLKQLAKVLGHQSVASDSSRRLTGFGFCNLCEVNVAKIESEDMFQRACIAAAFIGTLQATFNSFPYLGTTTEAIQRREALLGVGLTGMADNPKIAFNHKLLRIGAKLATESNQAWAKKLGIKQAARVTTIKPSGTASVALGVVGSGIHPHHARRYFRRITANPVEPQAQHFKSVNPHMVEMKPDGNWSIVFPIEAPEDAVTVKETSAAEFMERVFDVYENWVQPGTARPESSPGLTHNVSCTVAFNPEEFDDVIERTFENRWRVAAMSYVPQLLDKLFPFAPREEVVTEEDEAKWNRLINGYRPVDWLAARETVDNTNPQGEIACSAGGCEIT